MSLTNGAIQNAKAGNTPYRLKDRGGLYLEVRVSAAKYWRYRYKIKGKENVFTIGRFCPSDPDNHVSVDAARLAHAQARALVKMHIHPTQHRDALKREQKPTFRCVAEEWLLKKEEKCTKEYTRQIHIVLIRDVFPFIGARPVDEISARQILDVLKLVEERGANSYAPNIRQWIGSIYRYAIATLRAQQDPTSALRGALTRRPVKHSRALSAGEFGEFLTELGCYRGDPTTVLALKMMVLTFVRTSELLGARWEEFNLETAEWRIPANRMKMREPHIVPLSRQALLIMQRLWALNHHQEFIFPNTRTPNTPLSGGTLNQALVRMGFAGKNSIGFTAHGFRSTACTMLNEAGFRPDIIELQLAHKERNSTRASYNRAVYLTERREMMQIWADIVDQLRGPPPDAASLTRHLRPAAPHNKSAVEVHPMGHEDYRPSETAPVI